VLLKGPNKGRGPSLAKVELQSPRGNGPNPARKDVDPLDPRSAAARNDPRVVDADPLDQRSAVVDRLNDPRKEPVDLLGPKNVTASPSLKVMAAEGRNAVSPRVLPEGSPRREAADLQKGNLVDLASQSPVDLPRNADAPRRVEMEAVVLRNAGVPGSPLENVGSLPRDLVAQRNEKLPGNPKGLVDQKSTSPPGGNPSLLVERQSRSVGPRSVLLENVELRPKPKSTSSHLVS